MIYLLIFIAQITSNALGIFRTILIVRDEKIAMAIVCFMQAIISIIAEASVLTSLFTDPLQAVAYIVGCMAGCILGFVLDEKVAIGQNMVTIIVEEEESKALIDKLRTEHFAVTVLSGRGIEKKKSVLLVALNRKKEKKLLATLIESNKNAVVFDESVSSTGGYM